MAVKGNTLPSIIDVAKRLDPDGNIDMIAELLAEVNEIIMDMPVLEGNLPTGHRETVRTGLPDSYWRKFNKGVPISKSRTQQITNTIGMLEARSHVDMELANLNGNSAEWRFSEDKAFLESMSQNMAETIFYGNEAINPERFTGLAPRFSDLSAENGQNIIDAGGTTGNLTSIWLVCWDSDTVNMRFPKQQGGSSVLSARDLGEESVQDADGNYFQALRMLYAWHLGLNLKDWRYVVRVANIPVDTLAEDGSTADLWNHLIQAMHKLFSLKKGKCCFYMNRTVMQYLDLQSFNKDNVQLTQQEVDGDMLTKFRNIPFRLCDALLNTESRVVAS